MPEILEDTMTDQSVMPFGKHEGEKMGRVPASYLLWLWDEGGLWDNGREHHPADSSRSAVHHYIKENFSALEMDCPDRIITHRP